MGAVLGLLALAVAVSVWVEATGGTDLSVAGLRVHMHSSFNLRTAAWALAIVALVLWRTPLVRLTRRPDSMPRRFWLLARRVSGGCARADRALAGRRVRVSGRPATELGSGAQVAKRAPGD